MAHTHAVCTHTHARTVVQRCDKKGGKGRPLPIRKVPSVLACFSCISSSLSPSPPREREDRDGCEGRRKKIRDINGEKKEEREREEDWKIVSFSPSLRGEPQTAREGEEKK